MQCSDRTATAANYKSLRSLCGRYTRSQMWEQAKRSGRYKHELGQSTAITQRFIIRCGRCAAATLDRRCGNGP